MDWSFETVNFKKKLKNTFPVKKRSTSETTRNQTVQKTADDVIPTAQESKVAKEKVKGKKKGQKRPVKEADLKDLNIQDASKKPKKAKQPTENVTDPVETTNEPATTEPTPKGPSKRQTKKQKHQERQEENEKKKQQAISEQVLTYLSRWKHQPDEWKYEKKKNYWITKNVFNSELLPKKIWDTTVEYLAGSKGHFRQEIIKEALTVVDVPENDDDDKEMKKKRKRAREIVQMLS